MIVEICRKIVDIFAQVSEDEFRLAQSTSPRACSKSKVIAIAIEAQQQASSDVCMPGTQSLCPPGSAHDRQRLEESIFGRILPDNCELQGIARKIYLESESLAKKLSLCCDISNTFHYKNRYRNVLPYDQNRVVLKCVTTDSDSYINASPLQLPFAHRNYTLTQGPLPNTTSDFWQMIYEQQVSICIMLSKVMEKSFVKCHSYFPCKEASKIKFEHFECELEHEEQKQNYIIRRIRLTPLESFHKIDLPSTTSAPAADIMIPSSSPSRVIHHFQFITWPDFGVPEHTDHFLEFLEEVRNSRNKLMDNEEGDGKIIMTGGPPVVCHCSAGIGRTGTFVIVDSVISMFERKRMEHLAEANTSENSDENYEIENGGSGRKTGDQQPQQLDSLEELIIFIRRHRMGLIQTPQQLRFCWKTIVDWIRKNPEEKNAATPMTTSNTTKQQLSNSDNNPP